MNRVVELNVYPVKSTTGWSVESATLCPTGFEHDREWMVIDEQGYFLSQRQFPKMATIISGVTDGGIVLSAEGLPALFVPIVASTNRAAQIWENSCEVNDQGDDAARWLSGYLGKPVRLVRMAEGFSRVLKTKYQKTGTESVAFTDSMPFLLTSEASLADLNAKLAAPLPMNRFRANIVIDGERAFEEDSWKKIKIGETLFRVSKGCTRCEITTIDQITGEKGSEPLQTLGTYRTGPKGILFGQHLIHEGTGSINVGDEIVVIE